MEQSNYGRRTDVDLEAAVQSGSRRVVARLVAVGTGGLALETGLEVALDRFVRIHARLLPDASPLDVDAIVRRRQKQGEKVRWDLELVNPAPGALTRIEECLDRQRAAPQECVVAVAAAKTDQPERTSRPVGESAELRGLFASALAEIDP